MVHEIPSKSSRVTREVKKNTFKPSRLAYTTLFQRRKILFEVVKVAQTKKDFAVFYGTQGPPFGPS
jgi:hypothetical protein